MLLEFRVPSGLLHTKGFEFFFFFLLLISKVIEDRINNKQEIDDLDAISNSLIWKNKYVMARR